MIRHSSSARPCKYLHPYYKKNYAKFLQKKGKKYFFKYFVKIPNLEIIQNLKLIFLAEHVLLTASGM